VRCGIPERTVCDLERILIKKNTSAAGIDKQFNVPSTVQLTCSSRYLG